MKKYLYQNHMGGLYVSDEYLDTDDTYCEQCGDYDWSLGTFSTINEFWDLIESNNGVYNYQLEYLYPLMVNTFELPDNVQYEDQQYYYMGICCNNYDEMVRRIEELIGREIKKDDDYYEDDYEYEE